MNKNPNEGDQEKDVRKTPLNLPVTEAELKSFFKITNEREESCEGIPFASELKTVAVWATMVVAAILSAEYTQHEPEKTTRPDISSQPISQSKPEPRAAPTSEPIPSSKKNNIAPLIAASPVKPARILMNNNIQSKTANQLGTPKEGYSSPPGMESTCSSGPRGKAADRWPYQNK